jgi:hypothetical protein
VTLLDNQRSARVCEKLGMRVLGVTHRWYGESRLMFWAGAHPHQSPTLNPDQPAPDAVVGAYDRVVDRKRDSKGGMARHA